MQAIGIIPARYASTRFPGKPLVEINGKAMIQHVYEQASKCTLFKDIYVATDDERIEHCVKTFGGQCVMTSPDHQSGTDRCEEALSIVQKGRHVVTYGGNVGQSPLIGYHVNCGGVSRNVLDGRAEGVFRDVLVCRGSVGDGVNVGNNAARIDEAQVAVHNLYLRSVDRLRAFGTGCRSVLKIQYHREVFGRRSCISTVIFGTRGQRHH